MANIRIKDLPADGAPKQTDLVPIDLGSTRHATVKAVVESGRPTASKAEAEAGVEPQKAMTPLTTKQAIDAQVGAAYVPKTVKVNAGSGMTGGGSLSGDVTVGLNTANVDRLAKVDGIEAGAQVNTVASVAGKTGAVTLDANDVGAVPDTLVTDINANTTARHTHANKAILDATTASFLAAEKTKLTGIEAGAQVNTVTSVAGKTGAVSLVKADVGLGNVDNTSDASKPVSTATQTALNAKANSSVTVSAGSGLTGGGNLTANRTVALNAASIASLGKADSAIQAPGGTAGQVLSKSSATEGDVSWADVAGATAVSYGPQTLTPEQQGQARANIDTSISPVKNINDFDNENPIFISHRNQALLYADQTLGAFRKSAKSPYVDALELDCRVILDGTAVCFHDATVDRITTSSGLVENLNSSQFKNLFVDAHVWHGGTVYDDTEVVTVREVLKEFNGKKLFMPEIKTAGRAQDVIDVFIEEGVRKDHAVFSSFVMSDLPPVIASGYPAMFNTSGGTQQDVDDAVAMGVTWVGLSRSASDSIVSMWVNSGIKVVMWTVNRRYDRDRLLALGVYGFYSDDVEYIGRDKAASSVSRFHTGNWNFGMIAADDSLSAQSRGRLGSDGTWGFPIVDDYASATRRSVLMGWANPLPSEEKIIYLDVNFVESDVANGWVSVALTEDDRPFPDDSSIDNYTNGVNLLIQKSGDLSIFKINNGSATSIANIPVGDRIGIDNGSSAFIKVKVSGGNVTLSRLKPNGELIYQVSGSIPSSDNYRNLHILKRSISVSVKSISIFSEDVQYIKARDGSVQTGSFGDVKYRMHDDGTMEYWSFRTMTPVANSATTATFLWPFDFIELPANTANAYGSSDAIVRVTVGGNLSEGHVNLTRTNTTNTGVSIHSIGRWRT